MLPFFFQNPPCSTPALLLKQDRLPSRNGKFERRGRCFSEPKLERLDSGVGGAIYGMYKVYIYIYMRT